MNIIEKWKVRAYAALACVADLQVLFVTSLVEGDPDTQSYLEHSKQPCRIVGLEIDAAQSKFDEEALPYYQVRFDDGTVLFAGNEELFSHDTRWFDLASAVCGGFAVARELGFVGPVHLNSTGLEVDKAKFTEKLATYRVTQCDQNFNTPAAYRAPLRGPVDLAALRAKLVKFALAEASVGAQEGLASTLISGVAQELEKGNAACLEDLEPLTKALLDHILYSPNFSERDEELYFAVT